MDLSGDPEIVLRDGQPKRLRYDCTFPPKWSDLAIEQYMIERGGRPPAIKEVGAIRGNGLFFHHRRFEELAWPEDDHHEWSDLILKALVEPELLSAKYAGNNLVSIMGPKDAGKSYPLAKFALTDYWCHPHDTLILVSSTELRGAGLRIWGAMKELFSRAREKHPWLEGKVLEARNCITTDDLKDDEVRDPRKGIIFIPMFGAGGQYLGLRQYSGVKQKRRVMIGDEVQFMPLPYLNVPAALFAENAPDRSRGTWFCFLGNPIGQLEPLDRFSEPLRGWGTEDQALVTKHWQNKFGGVTLNLVGLDSPNMHQKRLRPKKYAYMIGQSDIEWTKKFYGEESSHYWQLVVGMRKAGMMARRVVTRQLAVLHHALEDVIWEGTHTTRVLGLDAAYGSVGGDRCVIVPVEFGSALDPSPEKDSGIILGQATPGTRIVLKVYSGILVPVGVAKGGEPEDQIARFTKQTALNMGIGPENVFFDGRATLAMAFSRLWSNEVNAVDFGGTATKRPVSLDHWTFDVDTRERRLKRCDEEYSKFVTELWFSVRLAIESSQIRGLPDEILDEGCQREWKLVRGDRKEVETKADMKLRTNQSPDFFDALVTAVEGARRRGFQISKLSEGTVPGSHRWLRDAWRQQRSFREERELHFSR